jgi:hypothetical protein
VRESVSTRVRKCLSLLAQASAFCLSSSFFAEGRSRESFPISYASLDVGNPYLFVDGADIGGLIHIVTSYLVFGIIGVTVIIYHGIDKR